ncbi:MAG: DNA replication/repair protein RecF, partial [Alphaproteobacteria bacterium]|nr:DNA replication/repair protein RecF [Alphaproteobacteria bacterium]
MKNNLNHAIKYNAEPEICRLSVRNVALNNFRNYNDLILKPGESSIVLTGANGSGKTNLLEAISMLVPGKGMRRAPLSELQKQNTLSKWAISVETTTPLGIMRIGTGSDPETPDADRRIISIDGKIAKNQQTLADHVVMTWITPDMDKVLAESPGTKRRFLDRLVYSFDPAHAGRVQRYEKALRERLFLLREGSRDIVWLSVLEDTLAQTGVAIAAARRQMLQHLQSAIHETSGAFPQADIALDGMAERLLDELPALLVEDRMRAELALARSEDAQNGNSSIGPHRSNLITTHLTKQCPAELCSTGEQKALLIAIMLAFARVLTSARQSIP